MLMVNYIATMPGPRSLTDSDLSDSDPEQQDRDETAHD